MQSWILDGCDDGIADVWQIKMVSLDDVARQFETALPKGGDIIISNFTFKKSNWIKNQKDSMNQKYVGQSDYEIHITERTKVTILYDR